MSTHLVWIATSLVVFLSSGIQSMTGFGFAVLAMPLLVLLQNPRDAVGTSMVLSTLCVIFIWWRTRTHERLHINKRLFGGALAGAPLGLLGLAYVNIDILKLIIGGVTVLIAIVSIVAVLKGHREASETGGTGWTRSTWAAGFVSGLLTGSISMPGPPIVALLSGRGVEKSAYRATLMAYFILIYPTVLVAMVITKLISIPILASSVTHVPALLFGMWLGDTMHEISSQNVFATMSMVILAAAGALCVWTGVSGILAP